MDARAGVEGSFLVWHPIVVGGFNAPTHDGGALEGRGGINSRGANWGMTSEGGMNSRGLNGGMGGPIELKLRRLKTN